MKIKAVSLLAVLALVLGTISLFAAETTTKPFVANPNAKDVTVITKIVENGFEPKDVTVYEGQKVTLEISAPGEANAYTFTLPEFKISKVIEKGKTEKVTFEANKVGVFKFAATEKETVEKAEGAFTGNLNVEKPKN
jgi:plastocyanin